MPNAIQTTAIAVLSLDLDGFKIIPTDSLESFHRRSAAAARVAEQLTTAHAELIRYGGIKVAVL